MDVLCFSFDCTFNDDGSSNCNTTDRKNSKTTTFTPTTPLAPLPTHPKSHSTSTQTTSAPTPSPGKPSTTPTPTVKSTSPNQSSQKSSVVTSQKSSVVTTQKPAAVTTQKSSIATTLEPKPSPGKPSSTPISTWKPTSSNPSSQKPTDATSHTSPRHNMTTMILPHILTTPVSVTTTANNSRLPESPMPHKVTSYAPVDSADGKQIYIPCSLVGCVVVFLFVSISIIRCHRIRRRSSADRQLLNSESECDLTFEDPPFQFSVQTSYVQPITGHNDPRFSVDDSSDTENNDADRLGLHDLISNNSDDWKTSPEVDVDDVIFDASNVRQKQRKHGGNNSGVV